MLALACRLTHAFTYLEVGVPVNAQTIRPGEVHNYEVPLLFWRRLPTVHPSICIPMQSPQLFTQPHRSIHSCFPTPIHSLSSTVPTYLFIYTPENNNPHTSSVFFLRLKPTSSTRSHLYPRFSECLPIAHLSFPSRLLHNRGYIKNSCNCGSCPMLIFANQKHRYSSICNPSNIQLR